jgi:hypothetical protein
MQASGPQAPNDAEDVLRTGEPAPESSIVDCQTAPAVAALGEGAVGVSGADVAVPGTSTTTRNKVRCDTYETIGIESCTYKTRILLGDEVQVCLRACRFYGGAVRISWGRGHVKGLMQSKGCPSWHTRCCDTISPSTPTLKSW